VIFTGRLMADACAVDGNGEKNDCACTPSITIVLR
jgi:hypothetical protein